MNLDITEKWAKEIALMSDAEFEENCKHIETLLSRRKQALRIHDVVGRSEQLATHECKFYVNAEWTKLKCECGKEQLPSG